MEIRKPKLEKGEGKVPTRPDQVGVNATGAWGTHASEVLAYTTKELSKRTWPDFERLFSQGNGWDFCWCMHFQRPSSLPKNKWLRTRAERGVSNRREKRKLVERGCAHGILLYAKGEPVGWCQYGPKEELPRIDNSRKKQRRGPRGGLSHHSLGNSGFRK